jgi:hypothetical protein
VTAGAWVQFVSALAVCTAASYSAVMNFRTLRMIQAYRRDVDAQRKRIEDLEVVVSDLMRAVRPSPWYRRPPVSGTPASGSPN